MVSIELAIINASHNHIWVADDIAGKVLPWSFDLIQASYRHPASLENTSYFLLEEPLIGIPGARRCATVFDAAAGFPLVDQFVKFFVWHYVIDFRQVLLDLAQIAVLGDRLV